LPLAFFCVGLLADLIRDAASLAHMQPEGRVTPRSVARAMLYDGYAVLAMTRVRQFARRWHIPGVNRALRLAQMTFYNIEISSDARLGEGVCFVHTNGVVVGGDARIGARTLLLGGITVGNVGNRGYPTIGEDVVIGAGARVLGPVTIGPRAQIGANAVVLSDVPAGATAVGVPAIVRTRGAEAAEAPKDGE
jgi:serine O-acetyltransferase